MLYNLKLLGFKAPRAYQCEFGETVREVQEVHEALLRFKTKFHAAFARSVPKIVLISLHIFLYIQKPATLLGNFAAKKNNFVDKRVRKTKQKGNTKGKNAM